jgi:ATP-dependent DNA helicase DinG
MYRTNEQRELAQRVADAITNHERLLVQAATGVGKTRVMLIEALRATANHKRVLIATSNTQLARQMLTSTDMAAARSQFPGIEPVMRLSMSQFLSPTRAAATGLSIEPDDTLDSVLARHRDVKGSQICLSPSCPTIERLDYAEQARAVRSAQIVITTHAALVLDARMQFRLLGSDKFDIVFVDEADQLPASARSVVERVVTSGELKVLADALREAGVARSGLAAAASKLDAGDIQGAMVNVIEASRKAEEIEDVDLRDALAAVAIAAHDVINAEDRPGVRVAAIDGGVRVIYRRPARVLRRLFENVAAAMLLSGTLAPRGDFRPIRAATGLYDVPELVIEPRRFGDLRLFLAARDIPAPNDPTGRTEWIDYVAAGVRAAVADGGRVLVLTTGYADTEDICGRLRDVPTLIEHRRGERLVKVLEQAGENAVVVTPAAWAGVDIPGGWAHIVIPRVPFEPPDDEYDEVFSIDDGKAYLDAQEIAIRRLRQGLGRGIRNERDACVAWILDPRFPLSNRHINSGLVTQGKAARMLALADAIPRRFREGLRDAFSKAEIFQPKLS